MDIRSCLTRRDATLALATLGFSGVSWSEITAAKYVVPFPAGSFIGAIAQAIAPPGLQPEHQPGAGGTMATRAALASSQPTFVFINDVTASMWEESSGKEFSASGLHLVSLLAVAPVLVVARSGYTANTLASALKSGARVRIGTPGFGTALHKCAEAIKQTSTQTSSVEITGFKGSSHMAQHLDQGEVDVVCAHPAAENFAKRTPILVSAQTAITVYRSIPLLQSIGVNGTIRLFVAVYANDAAKPAIPELKARIASGGVSSNLARVFAEQRMDYVAGKI